MGLSLITQRSFTSTAGGSPDFLKMTGSTMAECSVSTSYSESQVNDSVATAELDRGMSGGRNGEGKEVEEAGIQLRLGHHYGRIRNDGVFLSF